uniref:Reverse transcriptase Ty1/copia-type domain-containing protein n=1 Tax=Lactuca sativa TaxID=4236 RepID=A0A9R1WU46_LACSA|nr:hypothetical protein LSAT_V11C800391620 [Lactuca sativa]
MDTLIVSFEGTEEVKATQMNDLNRRYEHFFAKKGETLTQTFNKFNTLVNDLRRLDQLKHRTVLVQKFLDSLGAGWENHVDVLKNSEKINSMDLQSLYGNLRYYEESKLQRKELMKDSQRESSVALFSNKKLVSDSDTESNSDTDSSKTDTDDLEKVVASVALIVKTFEKSEAEKVFKSQEKESEFYSMNEMKNNFKNKFASNSFINQSLMDEYCITNSDGITECNVEITGIDPTSYPAHLVRPTPLTENIIAFPISNGVFRAVHEQLKHFPDCNSSLLSCPFDEVPPAGVEADSSDSIVPVACSLNQDIVARSTNNSLGADEILEAEDSPETDNLSVSNSLESALVSKHRYHPVDQIIGNIHDGVRTRSRVSNNFCMYVNFVSMILPDKIHTTLQDADWIKAMQEELNEFERHKVWTLVPRPSGKTITGTRWVYRNKVDKDGIITRNKARLVAQGFTQIESIDYGETFAPVSRIEAIRLFLAYTSYMNFIVYQMDVKTAFLHGVLEEEVFLNQPPGFVDKYHPDYVYRLDKVVYGLKQAPRAWYETLTSYLLENGYRRGAIDNTLFIKNKGSDMVLVQIYVDDIIFGSPNEKLSKEFVEIMSQRFEMSMMGKMTFFLGLELQQQKSGISICQGKYISDLLVKYSLSDCKPASTPVSKTDKIHVDPTGTDVNHSLY